RAVFRTPAGSSPDHAACFRSAPAASADRPLLPVAAGSRSNVPICLSARSGLLDVGSSLHLSGRFIAGTDDEKRKTSAKKLSVPPRARNSCWATTLQKCYPRTRFSRPLQFLQANDGRWKLTKSRKPVPPHNALFA